MPARRLLIPLLTLALAVVPVAEATAKRSRSSARAKVTVPTCTSDLDQASRKVEFTGDMRATGRGQRLRMRFTLEVRDRDPDRERGARTRWRRLRTPGFGRWVTSERGVRRYRYTKRVENLVAPARYRTVVRFHWIDANGRTVRRARRRSPVCRQRDLRANLVAEAFERIGAPIPGYPDVIAYHVTVRNAGRQETPPFSASLTVNGSKLAPVPVSAFLRGERRRLVLYGPPCRPGARVTVMLDAANAVDERNERDNTLHERCP